MFKILLSLRLALGLILILASTTFTTRAQPSNVSISDIAWNADGSLVALAHDDGSIEIVSTQDQQPIYSTVSSNNVISLAWNPIHKNRIAIGNYMGAVQVVDISGEQFTKIYDLAADELYTRKVAWSSDGNRLATLGETGGGASSISRIRMWDNSTGKLLTTYEDYYSITDIAWNPQNANQLLITGITDHEGAEILVWDISNDKIVWQVKEPEAQVLYVAWKGDATQFATTMNTENGALIRIHDASNGVAILTLTTGLMTNYEIAWSPSEYLAISNTIEIQVWDTKTPSLVTNLQPSSSISAVAWSNDGMQLAYGGSDGMLIIVPITAFLSRDNGIPPSNPK